MTARPDLRSGERSAAPAPVEQIAQLRAALEIVERLAGGEAAPPPCPEDAAFGRAYAQASGIARRRFHAIAGDTVAMSTVGIRALIGRGRTSEAAETLAIEMRAALARLARTLQA